MGSRLLYDLLSNGEEVLALRRAGSNLNEVQRIFEFLGDENQVLFKQIKWVEGDVNDLYGLLDFMSSCERVYHAAAVVSFHRKDADELMRINVEGTKNMVNAALDSGIEKFCHVSSTAALGRSKPDGDFTEKEEWKDSKWCV